MVIMGLIPTASAFWVRAFMCTALHCYRAGWLLSGVCNAHHQAVVSICMVLERGVKDAGAARGGTCSRST